MRLYALLLVVLVISGCVGGPGYPPRRTLTPPPVTESPIQPPTETPYPTVMPELPRTTPQATQPPTPSPTAAPTPPQTTQAPKATAPPEPVQQPITLLWKYDTGFDVYGVGITDDGSMVVAGSGDFHLYAFNRTGGVLWKYRAQGAVNDVAISQKGERIVATSYVTPESTLYLLDSRGNAIWKKSLGNLSKGVDITQDGSLIALGTGDGKIRVFDRNGATKWEYQTRSSAWGVWDVAFTQDGGVVAGADDAYLYVLGSKGELIFNESKGVGLYINGVAASREGGYIGVASRGRKKPTDQYQPGEVYLYQGSKLLWQYETGRLNYGIALTPKGDLVAVGSWDKNLFLLDKEGRLIMKYPMNSYVNRVAFSGDGKYLAAGTVDGGVYLFEVKP